MLSDASSSPASVVVSWVAPAIICSRRSSLEAGTSSGVAVVVGSSTVVVSATALSSSAADALDTIVSSGVSGLVFWVSELSPLSGLGV